MVSAARSDWYRGDYRAQIVAYGLAMLVRGARRSGREPDWDAIWNAQAISLDLEGAMKASAVLAQTVILTLPSGTTNAGEWAKKDACWERARDASQEPAPDSSWLVSRAESRYQQTEARKQGKQDDVIALQRRVFALCESGYWADLSRWSGLPDVATETQKALIVRASTISGFMKIGLERDWARLSELAKSCDEAGFKPATEAGKKQL